MAKATLEGSLLFPSEFVQAVELKGQDRSATIAKVERAELPMVGGKKKPAPVIHFEETPKKLVLNKTNAGIIADLHGTVAEDWVGKRITLYPTTCKFGGKTVDCIRVRETVPPPKTGAKPAPAQDWPPGCAVGKPGCATDRADFAKNADGSLTCANHA